MGKGLYEGLIDEAELLGDKQLGEVCQARELRGELG